MALGKDVLYKNIWITAMVEISSDIALCHGVHDVDVFIRTIKFPDRRELGVLILLSIT